MRALWACCDDPAHTAMKTFDTDGVMTVYLEPVVGPQTVLSRIQFARVKARGRRASLEPFPPDDPGFAQARAARDQGAAAEPPPETPPRSKQDKGIAPSAEPRSDGS